MDIDLWNLYEDKAYVMVAKSRTGDVRRYLREMGLTYDISIESLLEKVKEETKANAEAAASAEQGKFNLEQTHDLEAIYNYLKELAGY